MTSLDIENNGEFFVSGSSDRLIKIWLYNEGITVAIGYGHSSTINAVKFSPDLKTLVSVGCSGEIIIWELPNFEELRHVISSDLA